jgi:AraC-like DNA-binding protein
MYREHAPTTALAPYVDRLWTSSGAAGPRLVLPDGCIDILVNLARPEAPFVVGAMTTASLFEPSSPVDVVAVRFKPGAAPLFLRIAAGELTDREHDQVPWVRIDPRDPLRSLERALLARMPAQPNRLVAHAVARLASPSAPAIAELARETGFTRQYLGRLFHESVGITPKQLGRIARFQRAVDLLRRDPRVDLAGAAAQLGYCDQAHMARDFRVLAGLTPATARTTAVSIHPIRSLYAAS